MPTAKRAVPEYFSVTVRLYFEADHIACAYCPLLETYARKQCRMTGCYILDDRVQDYRCPFLEEAIDFQTQHEINKLNKKENKND